MIIRPFRALRPAPGLAPRLASVPYDVVDTPEARRLAEDRPESFLHVIRPEIDLPDGTDPHDAAVYAQGRRSLDAFVERGWLVRDDQPSYFAYRLEWEGRSQTGVIGAAAVADYEAGRIKRHEHTRPVKENDRVALNLALGAHPGPVFLTYRPDGPMQTAVEAATAGKPDVDFVAEDGVRHTLWVVPADAQRDLAAALEALPATYVADGHHRAAAAARVGKQCAEQRPDAGPDAPFRYFLTVHFPSDELRVLDYNRVVKDLNGLDPARFLARVGEAGFRVESPEPDRRPTARGRFGLYVDGRWHALQPIEPVPQDDPIAGLDVSVLTDRILGPILGIGDPRTDPRIDFVGGIRGMEELEDRVDSGRDAVAFALWPTSLEEVMAVADADRVMPPKSTWFEPKLRSGLVVQPFEDDRL